VESEWIGVFSMAVLPAKEPLGVCAESIQSPHKFTQTLRLHLDKSEHLLVYSD
jgi:hypothetical protein